MCEDQNNCGRQSAKAIAEKTGFSKRSVQNKLRRNETLPAPILRNEGGSVGEFYCAEHLHYIKAKRREIFLYQVRRKQRYYYSR